MHNRMQARNERSLRINATEQPSPARGEIIIIDYVERCFRPVRGLVWWLVLKP